MDIAIYIPTSDPPTALMPLMMSLSSLCLFVFRVCARVAFGVANWLKQPSFTDLYFFPSRKLKYLVAADGESRDSLILSLDFLSDSICWQFVWH